MKTYTATIYASYSMSVEVEADNQEQALERMAQKWSVAQADCDFFDIEEFQEVRENNHA